MPAPGVALVRTADLVVRGSIPQVRGSIPQVIVPHGQHHCMRMQRDCAIYDKRHALGRYTRCHDNLLPTPWGCW